MFADLKWRYALVQMVVSFFVIGALFAAAAVAYRDRKGMHSFDGRVLGSQQS